MLRRPALQRRGAPEGGQTWVCKSWRCAQNLPQSESRAGREDTGLCRKQRCQIIKERGLFGLFVDAGRDMGQNKQLLDVGCVFSPCRSSFCPAMSKADWGWRRTSPSMEISFPVHATSSKTSKTSKLEKNRAFFCQHPPHYFKNLKQCFKLK